MSVTIALLPVFIYLSGSNGRTVRRSWAKTTLRLFNIRPKLIGSWDENAGLVIVNHQSVLEIVVLEALHPADLCWIAKREIADMPIYGHILKAPKMIAVDRQDKRGLIKLILEAKQRRDDGRVLAIFPEGTRAKGSQLLPFKGGAKIVAEKLGISVQPVVVVDSGSILDTKNYKFGKRLLKSSEIVVEAMPCVAADGKTAWLEDTREQMQSTLDRLRKTKEAADGI